MRILPGILVLLLVSPFLVLADTLVGETPTYGRDQGFDQVLYYVAAGNGAGQVEYQCVSQPGKLTSDTTWQIRKFTYNSSNVVTNVQWANGSDAFNKVCDSRASYTYTN